MTKPNVLVFSGHDPGGAAGVQADIEAIASTGCHCTSVITALTSQNTTIFHAAYPQKPECFREQIEFLLEDINIHACKIGMLADDALASIVANTLTQLGNIPVVIDPVLASGTGTNVSNENLMKIMREKLFPLATIITPNVYEAEILSMTEGKERSANKLLSYGCENVLITAADSSDKTVVNTLYAKDKTTRNFEWELLPHTYHGSGCTLTSSITGYLAQGKDIEEAVEHAQKYTWETLKNGSSIGKAQYHPDRFYNCYQ